MVDGRQDTMVLLRFTIRSILFLLLTLPIGERFALGDDSLPTLIQTANYDPSNEKLLGPIESNLAGAGLFVAGGIIKDYFIHIDQIVADKLNNPSISSFFSDPKLKAGIEREISDHVNNVIFKNGITNESSISAVKYIADQVLIRIIGTIMQSQGVSPDRQTSWEKAVKAPIDACIGKSTSFFAAQHCVDAYSPDAIKNIELGVVYEVASNTLHGIVPNDSAHILAQTAPEYRSCLVKITSTATNGFTNCVNQLMTRAADLVIPRIVGSDPTVRSAIPSAAEQKILADTLVKQYNACFARNQATGLKDENGLVQTTNCQKDAGNQGIYLVSLALYKQNIISNLGAVNLEPSYTQGKKALDSCWNGSQSDSALNSCLRSAVVVFTSTIANNLLAKQIPSGLAKSNPSLRPSIIGNLESCLKSHLPNSILPSATKGSGSSADSMNQSINICTGSTIKEAALKVAKFSLEETLKGNVTPEQDTRIVHQLVDTDFAACLGKLPTNAKLAGCIVTLKKNGAKTIAATVFPEQFDTFVNANGGPSALGLSSTSKTEIINTVQSQLNICLDRNVTSRSANDDGLNGCFKEAIKAFTMQLGLTDFNKTAEPYFAGKESDLENFRKDFQSSFTTCLDQKKGTSFSIGDYVANVTSCSNTLVSSLTAKIGGFALHAQIESHLPGDSPADNQVRANIEAQLLASLRTCLTNVKGNDSKARDACTDNLQRDGTYAIATQAGRNEILSVLKSPKPVKDEIALNATLKNCLSEAGGGSALTEAMNNCAKDYSTNLARSIGSIELNSTLVSALGGTVVQQRQAEIAKYLADFNGCLDEVHKTDMDNGYLDRLTGCATILESSAVSLIDSQSRTWMASSNETPEAALLKDQVSKLIPCLSILMPSTTYNEDSLAKINPTGVLQGLSQTIGQFIDYDVNQAGMDIKEVMTKLFNDFGVVGSDQAKINLINNMVQSGMVDQLLKALVRSNVQEAFRTIPNSEVPSKLETALMSKQNFDAIFDPATIATMRQAIANTILIPAIVQGKSLDSPELMASQNALKKQVVGILLQSPHFGDALLVGAVQNQINSQNVAVKLFAGLLYGKGALDWSKVRDTPAGKNADDFIRNNIMVPAFNGQTISAAESKDIEKQASDLVKKAMESYKKAAKEKQS